MPSNTIKNSLSSDSFIFIELANNAGMKVTLCNYGARVTSIKAPSANGLVEITHCPQTVDGLLHDQHYRGTTVGRVCNRIENGFFEISGKAYQVSTNQGNHMLHGGAHGFDKHLWSIDEQSQTRVVFSLFSEDGDQGFPGNVNVKVIYELSQENELQLSFIANTDKITPIDMCNHCYFSMGEQDISELDIQINAEHYLPVNEEGIPLANLVAVKGTDYDLRKPVTLSALLGDENGTLVKGIDHSYQLDSDLSDTHGASVTSKKNAIRLTMTTNQIAVQFYTAHFLDARYAGLCIEAQGFPNAINSATLPSPLIQPEETYHKWVNFKISHL